MTVIRPFAHVTIIDFVKSEGGVASTRQVAQRFGWCMTQARAELRILDERGELTCDLRRNAGGGAMYDWRIAA